MAFIHRTLEVPSYGFEKNGEFYKPSHAEIIHEFFNKLNVFKNKMNWLPFFGWMTTLTFTVPFFYFLFHYFSFKLVVVGLVYSMVGMGSFGTFWYHRYGTHRAFKFKNNIVRNICRNLVIKVLPDEIYIISHHVHHAISEQSGDPYNVHGGWLYCFLADVNHQLLNRNLTEEDYGVACKLLNHTGVHLNTYAQYKKWGSLCHPGWTLLHYTLNWGGWYAAFYLIGGNPLAMALFGFAGVWAFGVRTFNFEGHGKGKDRRREGVDFNRDDWSVNQIWPGYVAGEWHNNHHLYPNSSRSGFLKYQLDIPWQMIKGLKKIGGISTFRDSRAEFLTDHYHPYLASKISPVEIQGATYPTFPEEYRVSVTPDAGMS